MLFIYYVFIPKNFDKVFVVTYVVLYIYIKFGRMEEIKRMHILLKINMCRLTFTFWPTYLFPLKIIKQILSYWPVY